MTEPATTFTATIDGGTPVGGEISPSGVMGELFDTISRQLQDETGVAWPPSALMPYADLAFAEIIKFHPQSHVADSLIELVAGARQTFPADMIQFMEAICNMGTDGDTVGPTITTIKKSVMDQLLPNWMTYPSGDDVSHVITDDQQPSMFYVFPPQGDNPVTILTVLSVPVAKMTSDISTFPFDPSYKPAFIDYMIFRALSEETTIPNALNKANSFYNKFLRDLGIKSEVDKSLKG